MTYLVILRLIFSLDSSNASGTVVAQMLTTAGHPQRKEATTLDHKKEQYELLHCTPFRLEKTGCYNDTKAITGSEKLLWLLVFVM